MQTAIQCTSIKDAFFMVVNDVSPSAVRRKDTAIQTEPSKRSMKSHVWRPQSSEMLATQWLKNGAATLPSRKKNRPRAPNLPGKLWTSSTARTTRCLLWWTYRRHNIVRQSCWGRRDLVCRFHFLVPLHQQIWNLSCAISRNLPQPCRLKYLPLFWYRSGRHPCAWAAFSSCSHRQRRRKADISFMQSMR